MCDNVFEKAESRGGTVNLTSVYAEAAVLRVLYKKMFQEFSHNSQENICVISFLIKSNSVILHEKFCFICK